MRVQHRVAGALRAVVFAAPTSAWAAEVTEANDSTLNGVPSTPLNSFLR